MYKRQVLARGYSIARKAGSVLKSSADASEGDRVEVQLAAGRPVSYTHLDVYKRQTFDIPEAPQTVQAPDTEAMVSVSYTHLDACTVF